MNTKREWCVVCGAVKGECSHEEGYTDDIKKAYRIWIDHKNRIKRSLKNVQ